MLTYTYYLFTTYYCNLNYMYNNKNIYYLFTTYYRNSNYVQ